MQFFLGLFPVSSRRIQIDIAEPEIFLLERLSSTLVETIFFWAEDSLLPASEKLTNSGQIMQLCFGKFQLSSQRICIYLAESDSFLLERLVPTLVDNTASKPED